MIPKIVPPLTGLTVLVTRPAAQAAVLCEEIVKQGGTAIAYPAIEIEAIVIDPHALPATEHELVIFLSANAVAHGARFVQRTANTRIAAIGKATAAALAQAQLPADIVPEAGFDSEALLARPELALSSDARILIVRGEAGRELLHQTFSSRGMRVDTLEVYRRVRPQLDDSRRAEIEARWAEEGIDLVTVTSVETLTNLIAMLSERGREMLRDTPLVVPSRRIVEAAVSAGSRAEAILAAGADDTSMIGAMAQWRTRARAR